MEVACKPCSLVVSWEMSSAGEEAAGAGAEAQGAGHIGAV